MTVEIKQFSKRQIDKVGKVMRGAKPSTTEYEDALAKLNDWRELHMPIMNSYYHKCLEIAEKFSDPEIIVAARLKRMPTILDKIDRLPTMHLSQLQDVAGVRIIVRDIPELEKMSAELGALGPKYMKDYIAEPKRTGYRGQHFVYEEEGMLVEVQLRTQLQHLWATTVETIDFFRGTAMKTRPGAQDPWLEFFELTSSIYAIVENSPKLPQHRDMDTKETLIALQDISEKNNIFEQILTYSKTNIINDDDIPAGVHYLILDTDVVDHRATILHYGQDEYSKAVDDYERMEDENQGNIVLISIQGLKKAQSAYPNYFLNLKKFVEKAKLTIEKEV